MKGMGFIDRRRLSIISNRRRRHSNRLELRLEENRGIACEEFVRLKQDGIYCIKTGEICPYSGKESGSYECCEKL